MIRMQEKKLCNLTYEKKDEQFPKNGIRISIQIELNKRVNSVAGQ